MDPIEKRLRTGQDGSHLYVLCPTCGNQIAGEFLYLAGRCNECRQQVSTALPLRARGPKEPPCEHCGWKWNPRWGEFCLNCGKDKQGKQIAIPGVAVKPTGLLG